MIGRWKLRNGWFAEVADAVEGYLLGFIEVVVEHTTILVPSYWTVNGNSQSRELDLIEKVAGEGIYGSKG